MNIFPNSRTPLPQWLNPRRGSALRRFSATVAVLLLSTDSLAAQDPTEDEDEIVRFDFRTYPVLSATPTGLFYQAKPGEFAPLRFRPFERSIETFSYEGNPRFALYRKEESPEGPIWIPVAQAEMPEDRGPFLLFVLPPDDPESGAEFRLEAIDDSLDALPPDTVSFLNFTPVPLVGVFDVSEIRLPPGFTGPISLDGKLGDPLLVGLAVRNAETMRKVLQNRWTFYPNHRNLILLLPPTGNDGLRIRAYQLSDFVPPSGENP